MFTLIEIFDAKQYENILSPVSFENISKLIYVGTKETMTKKKIYNLKAFFASRKYSIPMEFLYVERDNPVSVTNRFTQIIKSNPNCIFDVTGGEDIILASVGIVCEKHNIPIIRTDTANGKYVLVHGNLENLSMADTRLTPEDFITIQGGKLIRFGTVSNLSSNEISDIMDMFYVNSQDCEAYSAFCNFAAEYVSDDAERIVFPTSGIQKFPLQIQRKIDKVINLLCEKNLLFKNSDTVYSIKSITVYRCIMKAGNVLELYTALALQSLEGVFSHIKVGTTIEWNDTSAYFETQNEIDVLALNCGLPVFISCKNGEVKKEALYELDAVSRALGGSYAKKILVCTHISKNLSAREHFISRARDMGIKLVYDTHKKTFDEFLHYLK